MPIMSPLERYQLSLASEGFTEDRAQRIAIEKLQQLYDALIEAEQAESAFSLVRFVGGIFSSDKAVTPIKGLYFWGGVGRGKTYLMDIFYDSLPFERKMRVHFHRFMRRVHRELKTLPQQKNPLALVAERLAKETRVICFDEFFVSDITDAMILAGLFESLFHRGVTLVATSNIVPDGLYKDGLQRIRFLPAIELLNKHTEVVNVDGGTDYRLRSLEQAELYHTPLDDRADKSLSASFYNLVPDVDGVTKDSSINVEGRPIDARFLAEDVIWFDFAAICDGPRSQHDYIEIAKEFHAVLVSDIPVLTVANEDLARRFINLVDEFYDRSVKLIISAAAPIPNLYQGTQLSFEFDRTISRLLEMQSHDYLALPHKP